ncbi:cell division protein ZipA [Alteromonas portus]|uniref:Cell division protein ZipA n=1 Tax=Alteromonas portus TaxID=2565549 RepID=A0A4U0ZGY9_9ALTE|nr:cell division protein ZipA [Alteromonas portus]TKB03736.1 cell division protein ZipA [Alteromonas portus]
MEDQLRLFLLLGGTVFIIAVLAHGIWKIRKNSKPSEKERLEPRQWEDDDNDFESDEQERFDELGIGAVRVVSKAQEQDGKTQPNASNSAMHSTDNQGLSDGLDNSTEAFEEDAGNTPFQEAHSKQPNEEQGTPGDSTAPSDVKETTAKAPKLYGSVVTNPKPHMKEQSRSVEGVSNRGTNKSEDNAAAFPEPPGFLLREGEEQEETSLESHGQREEGQQPNAPDSLESTASAQSHDQTHSQSGGHQERGRSEPVRPAQKFYIDPTLEEVPEEVKVPAKNEKEVADFSLDAPEESFSSSESYEENEQPRRFSRNKRSKTPVRRREEPNFGDDQMRIDFDTSEADSADFGNENFSANESGTEGSDGSSKPDKSSIEPEVLVLNVRTPEGEPISGAALLPMLLTLGFKFGDQDIFHRHVNSNGKGPVLFSLANMFKPGVFDIDNLENFETQGVSLFMILPIEGDPHQVFNMMHNAARKLADEFGAQVLDGRRSVLTKQGLQQYVEKIREFERKRMIARN